MSVQFSDTIYIFFAQHWLLLHRPSFITDGTCFQACYIPSVCWCQTHYSPAKKSGKIEIECKEQEEIGDIRDRIVALRKIHEVSGDNKTLCCWKLTSLSDAGRCWCWKKLAWRKTQAWKKTHWLGGQSGSWQGGLSGRRSGLLGGKCSSWHQPNHVKVPVTAAAANSITTQQHHRPAASKIPFCDEHLI